MRLHCEPLILCFGGEGSSMHYSLALDDGRDHVACTMDNCSLALDVGTDYMRQQL